MVKIAYNIYSIITKNYMFSLVIGEEQENKVVASKHSFKYKIKFVLYMLAAIISLFFILFDIFSNGSKSIRRWGKNGFANSIRIF